MADTICFPRKLFKKDFGLGLDGGGSCLKIAYTTEEGDNLRFHFKTFPKSEHCEALQMLRRVCDGKLGPNTEIITCGISTNKFVDQIEETLGVRIKNTLEFARTIEAFKFLSSRLSWENFTESPSSTAIQEARRNAQTIYETDMAFAAADRDLNEAADLDLEASGSQSRSPQMLLPSSMEHGVPDDPSPPQTGVSYPIILFVAGSVNYPLKVEADGRYRLGNWNPFGGKSLMGLGHATTGAKSFDDLLGLAGSGDQARVHEMVSSTITDATDTAYGHLAKSQLKCYGFGHVADDPEAAVYTEADMAAALVSTVTQTVARDAYMWAAMLEVSQVFFCGGLACSTPNIRDLISTEYATMCLTNVQGHKSDHYYLKYGAYLPAIGVLLHNLQLT